MQFKKLAAIGGSALVGLMSVAAPVLGTTVTAVKDIQNLVSVSGTTVTAPIFVIGSGGSTPAGLAADVAGAVEVAAGMSSIGGTGTPGTGVDGLLKDTVTINYGNLTDVFPNPAEAFHYTGLKQGTFSWKGSSYDYRERFWLNGTYFSHDFATAGINGTETMAIQTDQVAYEYRFDKDLNLSSANGLGTIGSPEYKEPVRVNLLGKQFLIVGVGGNQVKMLTGTSGSADATIPVTYGAYSAYATEGSDGVWAKIIVKDSAGTTVGQTTINQGSTGDFGTPTAVVTVRVLTVRARQDNSIINVDLVIGPPGAVDKTYTTTCTTGSSSTDVYPGETDWCLKVGSGTFGTGGYINASATLQVAYKPAASTVYRKMTDTDPALHFPNNYGNIGFLGFNTNTFATLTFEKGTDTAYNSTGSAILSSVPVIKIESDTVGTLVDQATNTGYSKAAIFFNGTNNATHATVALAFWDSVNSRYLLPSTTIDGTYVKAVGITGAGNGGGTNVTATLNVTLSYGGGAAVGDRQYLWTNLSYLNPVAPAADGALSYVNGMWIGTAGNPNAVRMSWLNTSTALPTATTVPEYRLYTSDSAETKDVLIESTAAGSGTANVQNVGQSTQDIITDAGSIVLSPNSNGAANKVVVKVPSQTLAVKAYVGKLSGGGATAGLKVPIVAKLDTEVVSSDKTGSNLVIVGGPCVNRLAAEVLGLTYPACGTTSTITANTAIIQLFANKFATGQTALLIAGWEAADTRRASRVVQTGTALAGMTAAKATVSSTGTVTAG